MNRNASWLDSPLELDISSAPSLTEPLPPIDLEFDSPHEVLRALVTRPKRLQRARKEADWLFFAYGYALLQAGAYADAREPLEACQARNPLLAPYAALLLGRAHLRLEQYAQAKRWLEIALRSFPSGERNIEIRLELARLLADRNRTPQAISALETLLQQSRGSRFRNEIRLELARTNVAARRYDEAIYLLEWLWSKVPTDPAADQAEHVLEALEALPAAHYAGPAPKTRLLRGQRLQSNGHVELGLEQIRQLAAAPDARRALPETFPFDVAYAHFAAKRYVEALALFDAWYSVSPSAERAQALYWRGVSRGRLGRFDEAIEIYEQLEREHSRSSYSRAAHYKIGLMRLDEGRYKEAQAAFSAFLEEFPRDRRAVNAAWYVPWTQLRQGRFDEARESYRTFIRKYPRSSLLPGVHYWLGRMAQQEGRSQAAMEHFTAALEADDPSHYAGLAMVQLERLEVPFEVRRITGEPEAPPELELSNPKDLERAEALLELGLRTWATEAIAAYQGTLKTPEDRLALAYWYWRTGNYRGAQQMVHRLGLDSGVPAAGDPGIAWHMSYPRAFYDQVSQIPLKNMPSWDLVYAIMRQESLFDPWATSSAGARGLMQLMPETAVAVAKARGAQRPTLRDLYLPETSIRIGAWLIDDLYERFDGQVPLVVAAYNAGHEAVERWLKEKQATPIDVFLEEISYAETRRYVRRVMTNLWIYDRLYGSGRSPLVRRPGLEASIISVPRPPAGKEPPRPHLETPPNERHEGKEAREESASVTTPRAITTVNR